MTAISVDEGALDVPHFSATTDLYQLFPTFIK